MYTIDLNKIIKSEDYLISKIEDEIKKHGGALMVPSEEDIPLDKTKLTKWLNRVFRKEPFKILSNKNRIDSNPIIFKKFINELAIQHFYIPVIYTENYVLFAIVNAADFVGQFYIIFKRKKLDSFTSVEDILNSSPSAIKLPLNQN